jgi:hypothetical protein
MASHHASQPAALLGDGQMAAELELFLDVGQLGPQPFRDGDAPQPEAPASPLPADVREAQEVERLRFAGTPRLACPGGVAPELDQPGLVGMQFQTELGESLAKVVQEQPGVIRMLEPPCGAPTSVSDQFPSSMTPALTHLRIRRRIR